MKWLESSDKQYSYFPDWTIMCKMNDEQSFICFHRFSLNRIPVVAARVRTMAHVKLDSPVKVFVVFVILESLEQLAMKVMYIEDFCISISEIKIIQFSVTQEQFMGTEKRCRKVQEITNISREQSLTGPVSNSSVNAVS